MIQNRPTTIYFILVRDDGSTQRLRNSAVEAKRDDRRQTRQCSLSPTAEKRSTSPLRLCLQSSLSYSHSGTKTLYAFLLSPIRATWPAHLMLLHFIILTTVINITITIIIYALRMLEP